MGAFYGAERGVATAGCLGCDLFDFGDFADFCALFGACKGLRGSRRIINLSFHFRAFPTFLWSDGPFYRGAVSLDRAGWRGFGRFLELCPKVSHSALGLSDCGTPVGTGIWGFGGRAIRQPHQQRMFVLMLDVSRERGGWQGVGGDCRLELRRVIGVAKVPTLSPWLRRKTYRESNVESE